VNGGAGTNSVLLIDSSNVTLQGGGMVTLATAGGSGSAYIYQAAGGLTLTNVDNTIQGAGVIGQNGLSVANGGCRDHPGQRPGAELVPQWRRHSH